jgi:hypothetical protein
MVLEDVARMGSMLVLAGLAVGWMSGAVRRAGGAPMDRGRGHVPCGTRRLHS